MNSQLSFFVTSFFGLAFNDNPAEFGAIPWAVTHGEVNSVKSVRISVIPVNITVSFTVINVIVVVKLPIFGRLLAD